MPLQNRRSRYLALGLSAQAGFIDALGFMSLGGYFLSFMSGNSTRFATGIFTHNLWSQAFIPLAIIALFVIGVMIGRITAHLCKNNPSANVLIAVTTKLAAAGLATALQHNFLAISLMTMAMGASNNVFLREGEVSVGVTYMTGTLVKFGQRLASYLIGDKESQWLPYLLLWTGLVIGAMTGAICYNYLGLSSIWPAVLFSSFLTLIFYRNQKTVYKL